MICDPFFFYIFFSPLFLWMIFATSEKAIFISYLWNRWWVICLDLLQASDGDRVVLHKYHRLGLSKHY